MSDAVRFRGRPGLFILLLGALVFAGCYLYQGWAYQQGRNIAMIATSLLTGIALLIWWLFFSRAGQSFKYVALAIVLGTPPLLFKVKGCTGDWLPIVEARFWGRPKPFHIVNPIANTGTTRPDFPQFLGPQRDGRLTGPALDPDWTAHPPQIVWRKDVGPAWSGFAIAGGKAVTQEERDGQEWVVCLDLTTGNELWRTSNAGQFSEAMAGQGPRATPTIVDGRVFTLGSTGVLQSLNLADGKLLWRRDLKADAGVPVPVWGFASSPLVVEGKVIVSAGGKPHQSLLAYQVANGTLAWAAGDGSINYSSPFLRVIGGRPQILMLNAEVLSAHDPATGALLWEYGWPSGRPNVAQPLVVGENQVFLSSGYAYGSELIEVKTEANGSYSVSRLWKTTRFQAKFSNPVVRDGFIYGISDGDFACLDLKDGSRPWKSTHYGHAQCLLVGDLFLQMAEDPGVLVLLRPTPQAANELARFPIFDGKTWNPIALSGDLLLMRNDREAACLRLPLASESPLPKAP